MRAIALLAGLIAAAVGAFMALRHTDTGTVDAAGDDTTYTADFSYDASALATVGRNLYYILEPGHTITLRDGDDEVTIRVLDETRRVHGVETRVVEERESEDGQLVEVSRNYVAISTRTGNVYYFGEDVEKYSGGEVVSREGGWEAGVNGATHGLLMPAVPLLGARYYLEHAPGTAMDRAEITSLDAVLESEAGNFAGLLEVRETSPLEPGIRELKIHAPDIGLVQDGRLKLVRYGKGG